MKNSRKQQKTTNGKLVNAIISIMIILPLCYLMYYIKIEKAGASETYKGDAPALKVTPDTSKLQKAIDLVNTAPSETNYINLSLQYYYSGKYRLCAEAANKALTYNPKSYAAYNNLCSAYNQLGLWSKAIVAGKKALEIVPGDALATNNLKVSTDGKAKQDKSLTDAEALVKTTPNEKNYMTLGGLYYSAEKYELAISAYEKAITYNSKNIAAYNNICSASNELGKWTQAAEYCQKALKIDSTYNLAKNNLKIAKANLK